MFRLFFMMLIVASAQLAYAQQEYYVTDLGDLPGSISYGFGYDINDHGQVVGNSYSTAGLHAFIWDPVNGMTDLGDLPGGSSRSTAYGINNNGQVVGEATAATGTRGFLWDPVNGMMDLGDLPGGNDLSVAYKINNNGQITGLSHTSTGNHAFLSQSGASLVDLGGFPGVSGFNDSFGRDINNQGQVVGRARLSSGRNHAILWDATNGMIDLGEIPGGGDYSEALGINDLSQVVGQSTAAAGVSAFLWQSGTGMINLGDLPGGNYFSIARDINNNGQIVGQGDVGDESFRAALWDTSGNITNLNSVLNASSSGWLLMDAMAINEQGWITGIGRNPNGNIHPYLLRPVPEPATLSLLCMGSLAMIHRRRVHK